MAVSCHPQAKNSEPKSVLNWQIKTRQTQNFGLIFSVIRDRFLWPWLEPSTAKTNGRAMTTPLRHQKSSCCPGQGDANKGIHKLVESDFITTSSRASNKNSCLCCQASFCDARTGNWGRWHDTRQSWWRYEVAPDMSTQPRSRKCVALEWNVFLFPYTPPSVSLTVIPEEDVYRCW